MSHLRNLAMNTDRWQLICWRESRSRSCKLNSSAGVEEAIRKSEIQSLAGIGPAIGPETILLVEDEAFVRQAAAEALESAGYRLLIARSAAEALEAYRECFRPGDLLLADGVMPGMRWAELAAKVQGLSP